MNGSGSKATPSPAEAIATSQSHWPLWAAISGANPAWPNARRRLRVSAKSSFSKTSGRSARAFSFKLLRGGHPACRARLHAYFEAACQRGGQTPHLLEQAFSWHAHYRDTRTMLAPQ
ncbi:acyl-CoA transferase [Janthinobacterium agaricidamnosum NBRC 102515 = DSM 9628]|uniref:Acyl-CoA transferase n=1 Tax=Janthinobacterium agaricidamnosum NBRC 102515 = DSM 9628 TaxID=1349767 RepID=W0V8B3_9BURK|nr:acyl-CoA transferase [Janthinobacterium agaricidamnosum NBRC 102515 = DSM 9628]